MRTQVSAGVAPCNIGGYINFFKTLIARQVSRKAEPLSNSATVATIAVLLKIHKIGLARSCYASLRSLSQSENGTASRP